MSSTINTSASPRIVTNDEGQIAPSDSQYQTAVDPISSILDRNWIQNAFMIPNTGFTNKRDIANRYWSSGNMKYTDTRLGANIGINPKPQFCHYSDIPVAGRLTRKQPSINDFSGDYGMGRQYSEFIDDPAQRIYMSFGVPQYNSLIGFFKAAYESNQLTLARTGRASSIFYNAAKIVGTAGLLYSIPLITVPLFFNQLYDFFSTRPKSKFYTLKPTMHLYWSSVNNLVQAMAINRGILPKFLANQNEQISGRPYVLDNGYLKALSNFIPDIFRDAGLGADVPQFDIMAVATKAQRLADAVITAEYNRTDADNLNEDDFVRYVSETMFGNGEGYSTPTSNPDGSPKLGATVDHLVTSSISYLGKLFNDVSSLLSFQPTSSDNNQGIEIDPRADTGTPNDAVVKEGRGFVANLNAQLHDGALFASFIVDYTGPQSESWANTTTESQLQQTINGKVNSIAESRFSLAEGSIIGGIAGSVIGAAASAVTDTAAGLVSGLTLGLSDTLSGLAGGGYIDIPKHWQSSSFSGSRASYSMQLISPYGNPISQLMDLDIPMAMLLAGALPRSTGKSSYTAPFLCQLFDRGRCQIRLGIIENLAFVRGTSHLGFSDAASALSVDVSFTVVDLSTIMHMPIATGLFGAFDVTTDEDSILQDYLAVLGGLSLESQIYNIPKIKLKVAKAIMNAGRLTSPAYLASVFGSTSVAEFMRTFTRGTAILDFTGGNV